jgi:type II secretory pathway component PulJ
MKRLFSSNSGLTMIELVSAVSLFIVILGALTMALNKTIEIWSPKHTNQDEKIVAQKILNLLEQDLSYAVADNGVPFDTSISTNAPTFIANPTINVKKLNILLGFIKYSSLNTPSDIAPALDTVFYTYYEGALFRRIIPLDYEDVDDPEHIGVLLELERAKVIGEIGIHNKMIEFINNPLNNPEPTIDIGLFSLIATKVEIKNVSIEIPDASTGENNEIESSVLPDLLFLSLKLYNDRDWPKFVNAEKATNDDEKLTQLTRHLGFESSRMIQFRTVSGTRLK